MTTPLLTPTGELPRVTRHIPEQRYMTLPAAVEPPPAQDAGAASLQLVKRFAAGGADGVRAMAEIYELYRDSIYRFIFARVRSAEIAEDLTGDTFLRALRNLARWQNTGRDLGAWLITIARNLVADHYKSHRIQREITTDDVTNIVDPSDLDDSAEQRVIRESTSARVLAAISQLSAEQRECIILRFYGGLSTAETAARMDKNEGAIKALLYRATRALGRLLTAEELR